jgi:cytidyltransferase-like protein
VSILTFDQLAQYRGLVSMVDGSFDPVHPGHLAYFRAARSLGYPLLCNLCPDAETTKKHPVLLPAADRAEILNGLDILTYVHVSERPTVEILQQLQPAYYVKGLDWKDKLPVEQGQVCDQLGIRIRYTETQQGSSTALLKQLQPDLDAFERLVLSQQPAREPWAPVTDYSFEARKAIEGPHAERIKATFGPDTMILDYGCGFGHLVRLLRGTHNMRAYGYEPFVEPDAWVRPYVDPVALTYIYDLVICREVLEHCTLRDVRWMVSRLCERSRRFVYITTRFNESPAHLLDVQQSDDLDPTHITLAPKDLLRALFVLEGFKRRADLEQQMDHRNLGRVLVYERG